MTANPLDAAIVALAIRQSAGEPLRLETNHWSHQFGPEGRCWNCDCRMFGRWAPHPCDAAPANRIAVDGVTRCDCGCKYWLSDRCFDCGDRATA